MPPRRSNRTSSNKPVYTLNSLLLLLAISDIILFWFESLRIRERVTHACRELCEKAELQLLDQTVALSSISLTRSVHGHRQIRRVYKFEVSDNGMDRRQGYITLIGAAIEAVQIEGVDGTTTIYPALPGQLH